MEQEIFGTKIVQTSGELMYEAEVEADSDQHAANKTIEESAYTVDELRNTPTKVLILVRCLNDLQQGEPRQESFTLDQL